MGRKSIVRHRVSQSLTHSHYTLKMVSPCWAAAYTMLDPFPTAPKVPQTPRLHPRVLCTHSYAYGGGQNTIYRTP